jgi:sugar phosphate isomerase/epimerase
MKEHWDAFCGLSLVHFMAFPECQGGDGPILESIAGIAHDPFFSALEVTRMNDPETRKRVAAVIEQSHMTVDFGAHPMILGGKLNLNALDREERKKAVETVAASLIQAAEIGARRFVILSGPDPGESMREEATKALIDSLRSLCRAAAEYKLSVVLETFDRNIDKKALIGPAAEAAAVAKIVKQDFPDFGLLYDMGHMVLLDEKPAQAMNLLQEHLAHVHAGNAVKTPGRKSYGDLHPRFGFPGGENDVTELAEFLEALFVVGYVGRVEPTSKRPNVGFEIRPQPGESSAAILANIKRAWNQAWPRVQGEKFMQRA